MIIFSLLGTTFTADLPYQAKKSISFHGEYRMVRDRALS